MHKIEIWQIKNNCSYKWERWSNIQDQFNPYDYRKVYEDIRENIDLENLFIEFNINHPVDFEGHSMSVSDVIVISGKRDKIYYVDSFGFKDITQEWKKGGKNDKVVYEESKEIKQAYIKYFDKYIKGHSHEPIGLYELTNRAINYCQEKLNLPGRLPVDETKWKE